MKDTKAILLKAKSLQGTGKVKDACELYQQLLNDGQYRPLITLPYSALLFKQNLHKDAYDVLINAISDNVATDDVVSYLLMMLIREGRYSDTRYWLQRYTSMLSASRLLAFSWIHVAALLALSDRDKAFNVYREAEAKLSGVGLTKLRCLFHAAFNPLSRKVFHPQLPNESTAIYKQGLWIDNQAKKTLIIPPTATFPQGLFNIKSWFDASQLLPVNCLFLYDYSLISGHGGFNGFSESVDGIIDELNVLLKELGSDSHAILGVSGGALVGSNLAELSGAIGMLSFSGLTHTSVMHVDGSFSSLLANIKANGLPALTNSTEYNLPDNFVWHHHFGELAETDQFSAQCLQESVQQAQLFNYPTSVHPVSGWLYEQGKIKQVFTEFYQQIGWLK